jgi:hypothetical protein
MPNSSRKRGGTSARPGIPSRSTTRAGNNGNGGRRISGASRRAVGVAWIGPPSASIERQ